jgi:hypothetical protein
VKAAGSDLVASHSHAALLCGGYIYSVVQPSGVTDAQTTGNPIMRTAPHRNREDAGMGLPSL